MSTHSGSRLRRAPELTAFHNSGLYYTATAQRHCSILGDIAMQLLTAALRSRLMLRTHVRCSAEWRLLPRCSIIRVR